MRRWQVIADRYTFRIEWSADLGEHIATVQEFPSLSWCDESPKHALKGIIRMVSEVLDDMSESGELPPLFGEMPS